MQLTKILPVQETEYSLAEVLRDIFAKLAPLKQKYDVVSSAILSSQLKPSRVDRNLIVKSYTSQQSKISFIDKHKNIRILLLSILDVFLAHKVNASYHSPRQ